MPDNFQSFQFTFPEVAPTISEVLDFLHSTDLEEEHPAVVFIRETLGELSFDTGITGGYIVKEIVELNVKSGILSIDGNELNPGRQVCGYIEEVCFHDFTRLSNELNEKGDIMEAYLLDTIGSLTVENAIGLIHENLRLTYHAQDLKISNRYSPGYCNWPLSDQQALFELIGENSTGITLSDSSLMTPRKSVSGVIGIGKNLKHHEYGCKICSNTTCIYRKLLSAESV